MELINVVFAKSIWIINAMDITPRGDSLLHSVFPKLAERYDFASEPSWEEIGDILVKQDRGYEFKQGLFKSKEGREIGVDLTVFSDGLVVQSRSSTHDNDAFLLDLLQWTVKEFNLTFQEEMIRWRNYQSLLTVRPKRPVILMNPALQGFSRLISSAVSEYRTGYNYEPTTIGFSVPKADQSNPVDFTFAKDILTPAEQRYISQSPTHSDKHLELLNELEDILSVE